MTAMLNASSGELRTIRLYGRLGARFGRVHRMAVKSAAEAVRALSVQIPGLERHLMESKDRGEGYAVFYGKSSLSEDELRNPCGSDDIRIAPMLLGAKSGWVNIILGAVLVFVGGLLTAFGYGAIGVPLVNMGYAMALGGIVQLLSPSPKGRSAQDRPENQPSYAFNGAVNTQAQGNPVPVLYGRLIVGSAVVSAGISAVDQSYTPVDGRFNPGGGGTSRWNNEWETAAV